jgi:hypothetical protein
VTVEGPPARQSRDLHSPAPGLGFQRRFNGMSACPRVMSGTVSLTTEGNVMSGIFRRHVPPVPGKSPHRREDG